MALTSGENFGPFRVIGQLGRGGMASVYKAYEPGLDRHVALKVLPAELHEEGFEQRFEREAKTIARLEHPNIVPIFNFGIEKRIPWMSMRLVGGGTLSSLLKEKRLPPPEIVRIVAAVADALDYAHGRGVVHRDVKPQNVLLDEEGRIYLADFGIARMVEGGDGLTKTGMITGTPQYMAPEQATGEKVDGRCDVYALGVIGYEMLTGRVPFTADTPMAVVLKHVRDAIPLPEPGEVPEPFMRPILKCLAKSPDDRWQRASDFAKALERVLQGLSPAPPPPEAEPATVAMGQAPATEKTRKVASATATGETAVTAPGRGAVIGILLAVAVVLGALGFGAWWAIARWSETRDGVVVADDPGVEEPIPIEAPPDGPNGDAPDPDPSPTPSATPDPTPSPTPPPSSPTSRAATTTTTTLPPVTTTTTTTTTLPMAPSLEIELEVVQDRSGPWSTPRVFVQVTLDERLATAELSYPGVGTARTLIRFSDVSAGAHRLAVRVSDRVAMDSSATIGGTKDIVTVPGINRLSARVRYLSTDDWTIRIQ